jgi:hypothetical protein
VPLSYTPNAQLNKPATADRNWDIPLNANTDFLDGVSAIGQLLVTPAEVPSASLNVRVTSGSFVRADGSVVNFPGVSAYGLSPASTAVLWLTEAGVLTSSSAFPATPHVRLATVATGPTTVQTIIDDRVGLRSCGSGTGSVTSGSTLGFFGVTPAAQSPAIAPVIDLTTGTASNSVVDVGSSFSKVQIDNNFAALAAKVNALIAVLKSYGLTAS